MKHIVIISFVLTGLLFITGCEKFFNPPQDLDITEDMLYDDWYEYRSVEMGLYGLQQNLVEQLIILGELRGDLLTITENADADLIEIYNFNVSRNNKWASPVNFFKLIAACNNFIRILEREHPEVKQAEIDVTNYDRLYGEALCMRAWAYFNAARIYGKVPYIHESLTTIEEITGFINSPGTYIDSVYIEFAVDGYYNDTIYNQPITLEKQLYDLPLIIDMFTYQLENEVKAVGVNHAIENNDNTWEVTIWNTYAMHALLGQMYLTAGDLARAESHFDHIMYNSSENRRYHLDNAFAEFNWQNIFTNIDHREHIYTIWFNKTYFQQNLLQSFFEPVEMHDFMLKPSAPAIFKWETVWRAQFYDYNPSNPELTEMLFPGVPGDFYRGYQVSFLYVNMAAGRALGFDEWRLMMEMKQEEDYRSVNNIMEGMDTMVFKFSLDKGRYDQDANFPIYRAAGIHLYMAEIYTWWKFYLNGVIRTYTTEALAILNDGSNYSELGSRPEMGVRGRVGFAIYEGDRIHINNEQFIHDPYTNEIIEYRDYAGDFYGKQLLLEEKILDERARELAFEGERFYDLMRVAKRRNDPSFLAKAVSAKYPAGKREQIYNLLMDEYSWYIHYFD